MNEVGHIVMAHGLSLAEASVLRVIVYECDGDVPPTKDLMALSGAGSPKTVRNAIRKLENAGLVYGGKSEVKRGVRSGVTSGGKSDLSLNRARTNPTKVGCSKEHTLLRQGMQSAKSAGADSAFAPNILMDRLLIIRIGNQPNPNEVVVAPVGAMKKHLTTADRDRYVAAWNERAESKRRARDGDIPADAHDRQLYFARWVFTECTTRKPTAEWIDERWKQRKRLGVVKRAA